MSLRITSGFLKGKKIRVRKDLKTRPTSSRLKESFFNIIQNQIEDSTFLDLFAGSGLIGIEALSLRAKFCFFVEKDKIAFKILNQNIKDLNLEKNSKLLFLDYKKALNKIDQKIDVAYIDPPYSFYDEKNFISDVLSLLEERGVLNKNAAIFFEAPILKKEDFFDRKDFSLKEKRKYGSSLLARFDFLK